MLQAVSNLAPRGVYVCGNTTSAAGLTVCSLNNISAIIVKTLTHFAYFCVTCGSFNQFRLQSGYFFSA